MNIMETLGYKPVEENETDENFEDMTDILDQAIQEMKPGELISGDLFNWEETLNASELCHYKMDQRL